MANKQEENHFIIHKKATEISKREILINILWIIFILAILYASIRLIGTDNLQEKVKDAGIFGPLILIFIKASTIIFAPLGGTPVYLVSGTLFGFSKGISYMLLGDFIGFTVSFHISRIFGKKVASYFLSKPGMSAINDVIVHMGTTKGLVQSCFVFIGFLEAVSYGAGLTKVNYLKFISIIMAIWIIPASILVALGKTVAQNFGASSLVIIDIVIVIIITVGVFWLYNQSKKNLEKNKSHKRSAKSFGTEE